jgi:hypothetical protein
VLDYLRAEKPDLTRLSYTKAVSASHQWHEQFKGKADSTGEYSTKNVVLSLTNGYTWVEVPVEDLKTEGNNMGHCVGGDYYQKQVKAGRIKIYSLRDTSNKPHVTVEITKAGDVVQVQGKENKEPITKYHAAIDQLWNHLKIEHNEHTARYITDLKLLTEMVGSKKYKVYVASNPNLPVELMKVLAVDKDVGVRAGLVRNPNLPVELMEVLAKDKYEEVRYNLARNPKLPVELMKGLIKDKNADVRCHLASNPNLPVELTQVLTKDKVEYVRCHLAVNPNLPVELMKVLAKDDDDVRCNLASNPNLQVEILNILAKDKSADVRCHLASNPNLPLELMKGLAKDKNANVRKNLASNSKLPLEIIQVLAKDNNNGVSSLAKKHPNYRKP